MLLNCSVEKTLKSPLDCKEIKPVNPKGNQPWILTGRTHAEAEAPILWPPDAKSWLIRKDPDAVKDWRVGREGKDRGWDGWMASPTQRTWVWVKFGSWQWIGRPGMLQSMGVAKSRARLSSWTDWLTDKIELNKWTYKIDYEWEDNICHFSLIHKVTVF